MYIETLDFALSCTARNFVPRWYDLGLSRARSHWRHCDELKINHFSVPRPPCIVGRHALEYQCIPLLCKLSLLKTSECQTSQILLSRNLYNRHQVLENYTLLASALSEILIPPFSLAEVYKLASWPVLHFFGESTSSPFCANCSSLLSKLCEVTSVQAQPGSEARSQYTLRRWPSLSWIQKKPDARAPLFQASRQLRGFL